MTLDVVTPEFDRMDNPPGHRVRDRLERMLGIDHAFQVLVVHRDAERASIGRRLEEIRAAVDRVAIDWPTVPVVPVRMTEAWLLLDEQAIREVAGRPTGTDALELPDRARVEAHPDPKAILQQALAAASGLSGRRLRTFERDSPAHRRQLLDRRDRAGAVCGLSAWRALEAATRDAMELLIGSVD